MVNNYNDLDTAIEDSFDDVVGNDYEKSEHALQLKTKCDAIIDEIVSKHPELRKPLMQVMDLQTDYYSPYIIQAYVGGVHCGLVNNPENFFE